MGVTCTRNQPSQRDVARPGRQGRTGRRAADRSRHDARPDGEGARSDGTKFDGVDLFLFDPHVSIDSTNDDLQRLADKIRAKNLMVGSLVAPVWPPTGGGSAMGSDEEQKAFLTQVRKACAIGRKLEDLGVRRYGIIRIDSAGEPGRVGEGSRRQHEEDRRHLPQGGRHRRVHGERLAAEGEICWGGMHSVKRNVELLEMVNRPKTVGFQADMAHTLLFTMGYNAPDDRILPGGLRLDGPGERSTRR